MQHLDSLLSSLRYSHFLQNGTSDVYVCVHSSNAAMASRAVVCCLSWQWTETDSYPAVCRDRWSWEGACQAGNLVPSTALPACRMKWVKLNLGVLEMKQLFYRPPLMHHRRITAFYQRTFSPCRVAHFSQHALKALTRGVSYTFANLEAGGSSAFFCVATQARTDHGNQAQHRLQSQHLAHSLRSTGSTFADTPAHSHPLIH